MNQIKNNLVDDQYPFEGITHTREIARGIVIDENNKVIILKIYGEDFFGLRDYIETSGGGIDENETPEQALIRELDEEIGYKCEIITKIGIVDDYYNLLKRHNINHYYLVRTVSKTHIHHESKGDGYINDILHEDIDEVIKMYQELKDEGIAKLVKERELPIAIRAKEIMEELKII